MASRIRQEDTEEETNGIKNLQEELQQEENNGVNNLPRRTTARRNQWRQKSAKKTLKKKPMASRICQEDIE